MGRADTAGHPAIPAILGRLAREYPAALVERQLADIRIIGRNWLGYRSKFGWVKSLTPLADRFLGLFPSLCANIYLVGRKAQT